MVSNFQSELQALSISFLSKDKAKGESDEGIHKSEDAESLGADALYFLNSVARYASFLIDDCHKLLSNG